MSDVEKICVMCGQSCAGQPRIKNEKGQYAHRACVQAKQESEPVVADDGLYDDYDDALGGMDDLLGDIAVHEEVAIDGAAMACPGCGTRMEAGSVVCMGCGYNTQSGKQLETKASKERTKNENKIASAGTSIAGNVVNQLVYPILGGCTGAAIGAGIWAAIAYYGQIRISILAWGIGVLVGFGVNIGSRDTGGVFYGLIAAVLAIGGVVGGNYITASLLVSQYLEMLEPEDISDDVAMSNVIVWEVLDEWAERGDEIPWPKKWKSWDLASWPEDFSSIIVSQTEDRWNSMPSQEQEDIRIEIAEVTRANSQMIEHDMIETGFLYLMMRPINIIFLVLAVVSAFSVASYE